MGTVSKKKERLSNLIKADMVKAVLTLIREERPITMEDIAKQCEVSKGTLYNYFKNKDDLLNYVHQVVLEPIRKKNHVIFESRRDPLARLYEFIDAVFIIHDDVSLYFSFAQRKRTAAQEMSERFDVLIQPMANLCAQGIETGIFIDVDPYILAETIYGTVIGPLKSMQSVCAEGPDLVRIKKDILRLIDRIIIK